MFSQNLQKSGDIIFTEQYMNYQSFKNFTVLKVVKKLFP